MTEPFDLESIVYDTLFTVGVEEGSEELTFASIRRVEAGPDGSFFVLNADDRRVSWFDRGGNFIEARAFVAVTGRELGRTTGLPALDAVSGDLAYSRRHEPFPQIVVLRRR